MARSTPATALSGSSSTFYNGQGVFTAPPGGSLAYSDASVPGGNTTTSTSETTLTSTYTIPANSVTVGMQLVVELEGVYSGTVLPTITAKLKIGSTIVITTGAISGLVSGTNLEWKARAILTVKVLGASGTLEANGALQFSTAATAALLINPASGSYSMDWTASQAVTVTIQWGVGGTGQTITMRTMAVYAYPITGVTNIFSSAPTFSSLTQGSVLFAGAGGVVSQDNANFNYDSGFSQLVVPTLVASALAVSTLTTGRVPFVASVGFISDDSDFTWDNTSKTLSAKQVTSEAIVGTVNDANNNTAVTLVTMAHNTSGTPGAGIGTTCKWQAETSTTTSVDAATITTTWATVTHGSRKARTVLNVYDTAAREVVRGEASGTAPMLGFLGASASAQLVSPDVGTALTTFGLASGTPTFSAANLTGAVPVANLTPALKVYTATTFS